MITLRGKAVDLLLACYSQEEIAESIGINRTSLPELLSSFADLHNQTKTTLISPINLSGPRRR